jgi:hypothetical protein
LRTYIDGSIAARVQIALQNIKPALAQNQPKLLPFIERLLHYTAAHGPTLEIRFQQKPSETLERAEKDLRKSAYFTGEKSLPGQYFDAAHQAPREAEMGGAIRDALARVFPRDLLVPTLGAAVADGDPAPPTVPTILVSYHIEMSGAFTSPRPRMALSGIGVMCHATFQLPGSSDMLSFKLPIWRAPDLRNLSDTAAPNDLYETMGSEAFKRFTKKYLATLFATAD